MINSNVTNPRHKKALGLNSFSTNMAAAGELKCIDSSPFRHWQCIHFDGGTEKRDQGICQWKRCFCLPSYGIRKKFNLSAGPDDDYVALIGCSSDRKSV